MKTKSCKAKARKLQQWVRDVILDLSSLDKEDVKSAVMGESGEDIQLSRKARELLPYSFECKNCEKTSPWKWYDQACTNSGKYVPVVIFKKNRKKPLAIIDAEKLLELMLIEGHPIVEED